MTSTVAPLSRRTPWHLWVLGILNLLWTAMGSFDFIMTNTQGDAWLRQSDMTDAQIATYHAMPLWMMVAWAVGVFGGLLGSILLLLRKRLAVPVLALSFVGAILSQAPEMLDAQFRAAMGSYAFMGIGIMLWALLIALYAWAMSRRGVLGQRPGPAYAFN